MFETIYNAAQYLGNFNMDKISSGTIEIFLREHDCPLHMISYTYNPRKDDKSENTDFRSWTANDWWQKIRAYYVTHKLNAERTKVVTVGLYYFLTDDYLEDMHELEWTNIYSAAGFNRLIVAPYRDGPVGDVYLMYEELGSFNDIDGAEKLMHEVFWDRKRVRYGSEEGVHSLPLILQGSERWDLIRQHCGHIR